MGIFIPVTGDLFCVVCLDSYHSLGPFTIRNEVRFRAVFWHECPGIMHLKQWNPHKSMSNNIKTDSHKNILLTPLSITTLQKPSQILLRKYLLWGSGGVSSISVRKIILVLLGIFQGQLSPPTASSMLNEKTRSCG